LKAPAGITLLHPENFPLDTSDLTEIDMYVPLYMGGAKALSYVPKMTNLKVLQMPNAGFEDAIAYLRPGLTICNARGVHDASTAELAVGLAIASRRGFPEFMSDQQASIWNHRRFPALSDSKVGIIGFGSIGQEIARKLSGFDVEITAFTQSGRDKSTPISELDAHLPNLDIIILILPLDEGIATAADIDAAVRFGFGFRYLAAGPCLQRDHAGLDIHYAAGCSIYPDLCNDPKPAKALKDKVDAGHHGMKVGQGFRKWDEESINAERKRYEGLLVAAARLIEQDIAHASKSSESAE